MPLPDTPITIHGGCNCSAIRYTVRIPELARRTVHPFVAAHKPKINEGEPTMCRMPFTSWDHCNDCRTATGALFPAWLCVPADMVTVTCLKTDTTPPAEDIHYPAANISIPVGKFARQRNHGGEETNTGDGTTSSTAITRPGLELLSPPCFQDGNPIASTWIRFHKSSDKRYRSFCGRCGTPLCYNYSPLPEGWPEMLDIVLGTVDREDLEKEVNGERVGILEPERQLWSAWGIPWLRRVVWGLKGPKHPGSSPAKQIFGPEET